MADEPTEPRQYTPKGHKIPVPERKDFYRDLGKLVKAAPKPGKGRRKG